MPFDSAARRLTPSYEVIGWGATSNSSAYPILQKAILPPYEQSKCEEKLKSLLVKRDFKITDGQVCAGGQDKVDSCRGEFGVKMGNFLKNYY